MNTNKRIVAALIAVLGVSQLSVVASQPNAFTTAAGQAVKNIKVPTVKSAVVTVQPGFFSKAWNSFSLENAKGLGKGIVNGLTDNRVVNGLGSAFKSLTLENAKAHPYIATGVVLAGAAAVGLSAYGLYRWMNRSVTIKIPDTITNATVQINGKGRMLSAIEFNGKYYQPNNNGTMSLLKNAVLVKA